MSFQRRLCSLTRATELLALAARAVTSAVTCPPQFDSHTPAFNCFLGRVRCDGRPGDLPDLHPRMRLQGGTHATTVRPPSFIFYALERRDAVNTLCYTQGHTRMMSGILSVPGKAPVRVGSAAPPTPSAHTHAHIHTRTHRRRPFIPVYSGRALSRHGLYHHHHLHQSCRRWVDVS